MTAFFAIPFNSRTLPACSFDFCSGQLLKFLPLSPSGSSYILLALLTLVLCVGYFGTHSAFTLVFLPCLTLCLIHPYYYNRQAEALKTAKLEQSTSLKVESADYHGKGKDIHKWITMANDGIFSLER